jgi:hypothetical protein
MVTEINEDFQTQLECYLQSLHAKNSPYRPLSVLNRPEVDSALAARRS